MASFNLLTAEGMPDMAGLDIPTIILGAMGLVLLIAFCIGFAKGARKVSWGGLVWVGACLLFGFVCRDYGEGLVSSINITMKDAQGVVYDLSAIVYFALAIASVLAVLLIYGLFSLIFRGKMHRKVRRPRAKNGPKDIYGNEYDDDDDFEWEDENESYEKTVARETANPSILSRFLGGAFCILNVATVIVAVLLVAVIIIDTTALKETLAMLYEIPFGESGEMLMPMLTGIAMRNGMDILMIGIMIAVANKGKKKGLLEALRALFMKVGNVVVVVLCLYLPFSAFVAGPEADPTNPLYLVVEYFVKLTVTAMGPEMQMISPAIGQLFAGAVMAIVASIVMIIINIVWRRLNFTLRKVGFFRGLDGSASCVVYLLIGAVICVGVWALIVGLEVFEVMDGAVLYSENAPISSALHNLCRVIVRPFLEGLVAVQ